MATNNEQRGGSGNFANDPKRASEAGKKGGEHSSSSQHQQGQGTEKRQQGSHSKDTDHKSGQR